MPLTLESKFTFPSVTFILDRPQQWNALFYLLFNYNVWMCFMKSHMSKKKKGKRKGARKPLLGKQINWKNHSRAKKWFWFTLGKLIFKPNDIVNISNHEFLILSLILPDVSANVTNVCSKWKKVQVYAHENTKKIHDIVILITLP